MTTFFRYLLNLAALLISTPVLAEEAHEAAQAVVPAKDMVAVIRVIDKVSTQDKLLEVPVESVVRFEKLEILPRRCWIEKKIDYPEHAALVEIYEGVEGSNQERKFFGWLFASSSSLSSLQHPYYDVTLVKCKTKDKPAAAEKKAKEENETPAEPVETPSSPGEGTEEQEKPVSEENYEEPSDGF